MAGHAVYSPQHQCGEGKHTAQVKKVKPLLKATENETEFYKKEELEENSNYSFKPIKDVKLISTKEKKIVLVLVRVKFLWMPQFHFKALGI